MATAEGAWGGGGVPPHAASREPEQPARPMAIAVRRRSRRVTGVIIASNSDAHVVVTPTAVPRASR
ncbi:MAG: hypothetical protein ACR2PL_13660 [Dehalococcoidia bacterium]